MILVISPVDIGFLEVLRENALTLIFIYIGFGLFFLVSDNARLVLVSMICAAILALFIRNLNYKETNNLLKNENPEIPVVNESYSQISPDSQKLINCKISDGNGSIHN